jgi:hypothetical protein
MAIIINEYRLRSDTDVSLLLIRFIFFKVLRFKSDTLLRTAKNAQDYSLVSNL